MRPEAVVAEVALRLWRPPHRRPRLPQPVLRRRRLHPPSAVEEAAVRVRPEEPRRPWLVVKAV